MMLVGWCLRGGFEVVRGGGVLQRMGGRGLVRLPRGMVGVALLLLFALLDSPFLQ